MPPPVFFVPVLFMPALLVALLLPAPSTAMTGEYFSARFAPCSSAKRVTCIVDGDTIWMNGTKIRIADINTPETTGAKCPQERALGDRATRRMMALLNQSPFAMRAGLRDEDRYGRKLRIITRGGQSLGDQLVAEGLAEPWQGRRKNWC